MWWLYPRAICRVIPRTLVYRVTRRVSLEILYFVHLLTMIAVSLPEYTSIILNYVQRIFQTVVHLPEYMRDFYEETTLSRGWISLWNRPKKFILDVQLEKYKLEGEYLTRHERQERTGHKTD
jgi:hypothetical protein